MSWALSCKSAIEVMLDLVVYWNGLCVRMVCFSFPVSKGRCKSVLLVSESLWGDGQVSFEVLDPNQRIGFVHIGEIQVVVASWVFMVQGYILSCFSGGKNRGWFGDARLLLIGRIIFV